MSLGDVAGALETTVSSHSKATQQMITHIFSASGGHDAIEVTEPTYDRLESVHGGDTGKAARCM